MGDSATSIMAADGAYKDNKSSNTSSMNNPFENKNPYGIPDDKKQSSLTNPTPPATVKPTPPPNPYTNPVKPYSSGGGHHGGSSSPPQSSFDNPTPSASVPVVQPSSSSSEAAKNLINSNLPKLNYNDIVKQGVFNVKMIQGFNPESQTIPRIINPKETITSQSGNMLLLNPVESARESLAQSEASTLQRIKQYEYEYPKGTRAPPSVVGDVFLSSGGLLLSGVGRGVLTNPVDVVTGFGRVVNEPEKVYGEMSSYANYNPAGFIGEFIGQSIQFEGIGTFAKPIVGTVKSVSPTFKSLDVLSGTERSLGGKVLLPLERQRLFLPGAFETIEFNFNPVKNVVTPIRTESGLPFVSESGAIELQSRPTTTTKVIGSIIENPNVIPDVGQFTLSGERLIKPKTGKIPIEEVSVTPFERNPLTIEQIGKKPLLEVNSAAQSHWFPEELVNKQHPSYEQVVFPEVVKINENSLLFKGAFAEKPLVNIGKQSSLTDFGFKNPIEVYEIKEGVGDVLNVAKNTQRDKLFNFNVGESKTGKSLTTMETIDNSEFFNFEPRADTILSSEIASDYALGRGKSLKVSSDYVLDNGEYVKTGNPLDLSSIDVGMKSSNGLNMSNISLGLVNAKNTNVPTSVLFTQSNQDILPISKSNVKVKQTVSPIQDILPMIGSQQDNSLMLRHVSGHKQAQVQVQQQDFFNPSNEPRRGRGRDILPKEIKPIDEESGFEFFPPFSNEINKKRKPFNYKGGKLKERYAPSVEAAFFNIKGKKPSKLELSTGLGLRPILVRT